MRIDRHVKFLRTIRIMLKFGLTQKCLPFGQYWIFFRLVFCKQPHPFHIGVFNKPKGSGGGADLPPHVIWLSENIFIIFFTYLSLIGYQGLESKSIAFYMKNCKSQNCLKNRHFGRKSEKIENSLFRNRTFHPKNVRQN